VVVRARRSNTHNLKVTTLTVQDHLSLGRRLVLALTTPALALTPRVALLRHDYTWH
jgi:hypothetical protein